MRIVYLHGFRSSPLSRKATMLRERLQTMGGADHYVCPQLPASPRCAAALALSLARETPANTVALIGSSLGGYYATWVAEQIGCRAVLLNPAVAPARDLAAHVGPQSVYFSAESIDFRPEYVDELRALDTPAISRPERYFLVAATGDSIIDYRTMAAKYRGAKQKIIEGSDHELSDFSRYIDEVLDFCGISATMEGRA